MFGSGKAEENLRQEQALQVGGLCRTRTWLCRGDRGWEPALAGMGRPFGGQAAGAVSRATVETCSRSARGKTEKSGLQGL